MNPTHRLIGSIGLAGRVERERIDVASYIYRKSLDSQIILIVAGVQELQFILLSYLRGKRLEDVSWLTIVEIDPSSKRLIKSRVIAQRIDIDMVLFPAGYRPSTCKTAGLSLLKTSINYKIA